MTLNEKTYLTKEELAEAYGISISTQSKYRMAKRIPFLKIGTRYIKYKREDIEAWLDSHSIEVAS